LKINSFAKEIMQFIKVHPECDARDILAEGIGQSAEQVEWVLFQLKIFGYL